MSELLKGFQSLILKHGHRKWIPLTCAPCFATVAYITTVATFSHDDNRHVYGIAAFIVAAIFIYLYWKLSTRLPHCPRNRLGVIISITTESPEDDFRIQDDLGTRIRDHIHRLGLNSEVYVGIWPRDLRRDFNNDDTYRAEAIKSSNSGIAICGTLSKRRTEDGPEYTARLRQYSFRTPNRNPQLHEALNKGLGTIKTLTISFPENRETEGFSLLSSAFAATADYVCGWIMLVAGRPEHAERALLSCLRASDPGSLCHKVIERSAAENALETLYSNWLDSEWRHYRSNPDSGYITASSIAKRALDAKLTNPAYNITLAITHFLKTGDSKSARRKLDHVKNRKCRHVIEMNLAFLDAVDRDYSRCLERYRRLPSHRHALQPTAIEAEEFCDRLRQEGRFQAAASLICGLVNFYIKEDFHLAQLELSRFLQLERSMPDRVRSDLSRLNLRSMMKRPRRA